MDNNGKPKQFFDVSKPGSSPATPNSRATITNQGAPVTSDPMVTSSFQSSETIPSPEPQKAQPAETPQQSLNKPALPNYREEAPLDLIKPDAFVTHVSDHKKGKKVMLGVVLSLLLLAGAAGAYWYTRIKPASITKTTPQASTKVTTTDTGKTAATTDSNASLFTSKYGNFTIENIYNWKTTETDKSSTYKDVPNAKTYGIVELAINDTQKLVFDSNPGGRGGDCPPAKTDVPFKAGNVCSSYEVTKREKLPEANFPANRRNKISMNFYLESYRYMDPGNATPITLVGILESTNTGSGEQFRVKANTPSMGAFFDFTPLFVKEGYIDIKIVDKAGKVTQLSEQDLKKVTEVLKTFKLQ